MSAFDPLRSIFWKIVEWGDSFYGALSAQAFAQAAMATLPDSEEEKQAIRSWLSSVDSLTSIRGTVAAIRHLADVVQTKGSREKQRNAALHKMEELLDVTAADSLEDAVFEVLFLGFDKNPASDLDAFATRMVFKYLEQMRQSTDCLDFQKASRNFPAYAATYATVTSHARPGTLLHTSLTERLDRKKPVQTEQHFLTDYSASEFTHS